MPDNDAMHYGHALYCQMIDLIHASRVDVAVCFVSDGPNDEAIIGVTDFNTAETWRVKDTAHRSFMTFTFGDMEEREPDDRLEDEAAPI